MEPHRLRPELEFLLSSVEEKIQLVMKKAARRADIVRIPPVAGHVI
jgi:hypothetical protein